MEIVKLGPEEGGVSFDGTEKNSDENPEEKAKKEQERSLSVFQWHEENYHSIHLCPCIR